MMNKNQFLHPCPTSSQQIIVKVSEMYVRSMTDTPIKIKEKGVNVKHLTLSIINKDLIFLEIYKQNLFFLF